MHLNLEIAFCGKKPDNTKMPKIQQKRHIAKTISWRFIGTLDTFMLSWFVTGNPFTGLKIGLTETVTKMVLYFLHERAWFKLDLNKNLEKSRNRHLLKTITWRVIGTTDTIILAWIFSGDPLIGLKIGGLELITKMLLYYLHERVWFQSNFGVVEDRDLEDQAHSSEKE